MLSLVEVIEGHESVSCAVNIGRAQLQQLVNPLDQRVQELAAGVIKKLTLTLALNGLMIAFGITPFSVMLFAMGAGAVLLDCVIYSVITRRLLGAEEARLNRLNDFADVALVNNVGLMGPSYILHESGHALASILCLKDAHPKIHFEPFNGGYTVFNPKGGLTSFGLALGERNSVLLITAAGLMASTVCALVEFAVAYFTEESNPTLSHFLRCHGVAQILNEVLYGLSTFITDPKLLSHDFMRLRVVGGINPLLPVALMILLPAVEMLLLKSLWSQAFPERAEKGAEAQLEELITLPAEAPAPRPNGEDLLFVDGRIL